ncbi:MAG: lysylphosphatidylglycerol synthase transmembrane domain-containing protein, partial [Candidatus Thorarchaeota archaeon]
APEKIESEESFVSIRKLLIFVFAGAVLYLVLLFLLQFQEIIAAIAAIDWWWVLPAMMGLSFLNYFLRYIKWQYYLRRIDVNLSHADSFSIFLAGFTLTTSPGKIGEAIKGYFIHDLDGTPIAKTVPVVVSERVTDLLAMVLLAMIGFVIGLSGVDQLTTVLLLGVVVLAGAIFLGQPRFYNVFLRKMTSFGPLKRFKDSVAQVEDTMSKTLSPQPMALSTAVSVPGWFMECLELWLLLSLMTGAGIPSLAPASISLLMIATFIHTTASVIGALSFLPGGLGSYEIVSVALIIVLLGTPDAIAGAATIIIRFVTLWFSVIVGFIALGIVTRRRKMQSSQTKMEE